MVKSQLQFTHHKMEMIVQAIVIVFPKKGFVYHYNHKSFFGADQATIAVVWRLIRTKHLLWVLYFLKQYSCEQVLSQAAYCIFS